MAQRNDKLWEINITSPPTFRTLMNIIDNILNQVTFTIVKTPEFTGLTVDEVNFPMETCLLRCCYQCDVTAFGDFDANNHSFSIHSQTMCPVLRNVDDNHVFKIIGFKKNAPHITINTYLPESSTFNGTQSVITTVEKKRNTYEIANVHSKKVVDMDLSALKGMIKIAKELDSQLINFSISTPVQPSLDGSINNFFTINVKGVSVSMSRTFHSVTCREEEGADFDPIPYESDEDDNMDMNDENTTPQRSVFRGIDCVPPNVQNEFGEMQTVFKDSYSTKMLMDIVKCMDKGSVQLYMCPSAPLVLMHKIGEMSNVTAIFSGCVH